MREKLEKQLIKEKEMREKLEKVMRGKLEKRKRNKSRKQNVESKKRIERQK